jgi:hypothetical protein
MKPIASDRLCRIAARLTEHAAAIPHFSSTSSRGDSGQRQLLSHAAAQRLIGVVSTSG